MVDRSIVYTSALPRTVDFLNACKFAMMGNAYAMKGCLGFTGLTPPPPYVEGLACTPTTPTADLNVHIAIGSIYAVDPVDSTAYSDLGTDTTHSILKQGILNDPVNLAITPPGTPGYSQIYLVEAILSDIDAGSTVLPYYNSANPAQPYSGPANAGTSQFTTRTSICAITLKAGVAAATGTQTVPAPDLGYVPLWQVTVTYGQTQITGANIALAPTAPFFPTLPSIPVHIQNGDWISADDTGTQNACVITVIPALTGLLKYQKFRFKVRNTNTGPATLTVSGFTGALYIAGQLPSAFPANAILANTYAEAICDGTNFELTAGQIVINNNSYTTGITSGLTNLQVFTASGTYIPTAGATKALFFATGGGGSGADVCGGAAGGGAGATAIALLSLSGIASCAITIGAGAAGVNNADASGGAGGTTTVVHSGTTIASAGGGGGGIADVPVTGIPEASQSGAGGTATVGLILITGGDGHTQDPHSSLTTDATGNGGASFWGGGGSGYSGSHPEAGQPGRAFGSGGGGSFDTTSGAGANGVVMIMEF
jgi:hypothetical protein